MNGQVKLTVVAVVLVLLPVFVFIGETNTVRVNGVVTQQRSTNSSPSSRG